MSGNGAEGRLVFRVYWGNNQKKQVCKKKMLHCDHFDDCRINTPLSKRATY